MKKSRSKLTLNRETIGSLTENRLSGAAGGGWTLPSGAPTNCATCLSVCDCPSMVDTNCCQNTNLGCVNSYRAC